MPNGAIIDGYLLCESRQYVLVVATSDRGIPIARQYKHGTGSFSYDLPGGYLNADETPLAAARRELREETGLATEQWTHLASLVLDNNRGRARTYLYLAENVAVAGSPNLDETEDLAVQFYSLAQLREMIETGAIDSLPSVAGIMLALDKLKF